MSPHKARVGYCQSDGPQGHLGLSPEHEGELQEKILQTLLSVRFIMASLSPSPFLSLFADKMHVLFKDHSPLSVYNRCKTKLGVAVPRTTSGKLEMRFCSTVNRSCFSAWRSTAHGVCLQLQTAPCLWDMGLLDHLYFRLTSLNDIAQIYST